MRIGSLAAAAAAVEARAAAHHRPRHNHLRHHHSRRRRARRERSGRSAVRSGGAPLSAVLTVAEEPRGGAADRAAMVGAASRNARDFTMEMACVQTHGERSALMIPLGHRQVIVACVSITAGIVGNIVNRQDSLPALLIFGAWSRSAVVICGSARSHSSASVNSSLCKASARSLASRLACSARCWLSGVW